MSFARLLRNAEAFARNAAPAVESASQLLGSARTLGRALRGSPESQYAASHGGIAPSFSEDVETANPGVGLVLLGELDAVMYWADKGNGPERFVHDFGEREGSRKVGPLPLLCFAQDGSGLVIARGSSPYVVTAHGIEG